MVVPPRNGISKSLILLLLAVCFAPIQAHVDWSRVNLPDPSCVALYHFDDVTLTSGSAIVAASPLPADRNLIIGAPSGAGMQAVNDLPEAIFGPNALQLRGAQTAQSAVALTGLDADLTVEVWLRWDSGPTSQSLTVGVQSGAMIQIARDTVNPQNDRFGVSLTHGDYVSAPGFVSWTAIGEEEAPFDEWLHFALTIQSTGLHHDDTLNHEVYNAGSTGRFWLNGHLFGIDPQDIVDLGGKRAHADSRLRIQNITGNIKIDELAVWKKDWSEDGTVAAPFAEGRGSGNVNFANHWELFN